MSCKNTRIKFCRSILIGSWDIEEKDSQYSYILTEKAYLECPLCKRLRDKDLVAHMAMAHSL